jgi:hypothetical protein
MLGDNAKAGFKRFLFDKDKGIFAAKGPNENLIQEYGRKSAERATRRAAGDPYWYHGSGSGGQGGSQPTEAQAANIAQIMRKDPKTRTMDDEQFLQDMHHLLSSEQRQKLADEKVALELTIKTPHGESSVPLHGDARQAGTFVLDNIDESTQGGAAAAAALRSEAGGAGGAHWNKTLGELSPLERAKVQHFLTTNSDHMKPQPASTTT